jgi:RND family efflux transporter MFP subunit
MASWLFYFDMNMKFWPIFLCGLLLAACTPSTASGAEPTLAPTSAPLLKAEGRIAPTHHADLAFRGGGRITALVVSEGDEVEVGVVLMELFAEEARAAVRQAEAGLEAARAQQALLPEGAAEEQKDLLAAQVRQAEAGVEAARIALEELRLLAPFAGTVMAVHAEAGEVAAPGQPMLTLADTTRWQVETLDLQEEDATQLRLGQTIRVRVPALGGAEFEGTLKQIALSASNYQGSVTYAATIELPESANAAVSWGMTAFIEAEPQKAATEPNISASPTRRAAPSATPRPTHTATPSPTLIVPTASIITATPAALVQTVHTVAEGENLFRIALRYNTTIRALMQANGLTGTVVFRGQTLIIPQP